MITATKIQTPEINLAEANEQLKTLGAVERIQWADEEISPGLYSMTSGGTQSAVLPRLIHKAGLSIPGVLIDTGNAFFESIRYAEENAELNGLPLEIFQSLRGQMTNEEAWEFYETDPEGYKETTKLEPLRRAISARGITAILSAVRTQQNENRAGLDFVEEGKDGELRIHPILDWSDEQVEEFIYSEELSLHPLDHIYGSIGDRITTIPGEGREGRLMEKSECGLHLK